MMKRHEIGRWLKDNGELRPYNQNGFEDGNFNYIHRTSVSNLLLKQNTRVELLEKSLEEIRDLILDSTYIANIDSALQLIHETLEVKC